MSRTILHGSVAEAIFMKVAVKDGFRVNLPFSHDTPYDFIIEKEGALFMIQVKKAYNASEKGKEHICCEVRSGKYEDGMQVGYSQYDFDYLAAVHTETETVWMMPMCSLKKLNSSIRISSPKWDKFKCFQSLQLTGDE